MTEGSIVRHLVSFALPLLIGNLFQQLYNTVDAWVVGNYVSNEAFSAVGTVGSVTTTLIGFFTGLASGAGVVISQYYGAKQFDRVRTAVHTAAAMTLLLGALFTAVGIAMTPAMLRLMKTPDEVYPESHTYLMIYFAGMIGLMIYNMGSGILRAVGDSRRPFYYLIVSTFVNIALDLVFVIVFKMGVSGVALATVIAQAVSAALVIVKLLRTEACVKLRVREIRLDRGMFGKVLKVGLPAALQLAITSFSNVFVQSYINYFGTDCMSGWSAYFKIDRLLLLPIQSLSLSATTFVGQNLGKNNVARAKRGARTALMMAVGVTLALALPVAVFAPWLIRFFNSKPEVVGYGTLLLRYVAPFFAVHAVDQVYAGALRGSGNSRAPMLIMLSSFVLFRQLYLFVMSHFISNTLLPIAYAFPAGWIVCSAVMAIYYHRARLSDSRVVEDAPKET